MMPVEAIRAERTVGQDASRSKDWLNLAIACLVLCLGIGLAHPFVDSAFNDDWSYADVARRLAATGHLQYNGWGSPTLLFQSIWAAMWIRFFGFSFDLLRWISLPFSVGFVALTYLLARRVGLVGNLALLAALTIATSPLLVPLAASFMTDSYGCAFTLFCLYAAIRAAEAEFTCGASAWLWLLTGSGILGGSERQTVWVAPLVLLPFLIWCHRRNRVVRWQAVLALAISVLALVIIVSQFKPGYPAVDLTGAQMVNLIRSEFFRAVFKIVCVLLTAALLSLPALLCAPQLVRRIPRRSVVALVAFCCVTVAILAKGTSGIAPFLGTVLTPYGIQFPGVDGLGYKPVLLTRPVQYGLTGLLLFALACWLTLLIGKQFRNPLPGPRAAIFALFTAAYLPLLFPGALTALIYDRYALPLLPLLLIVVLLLVQQVTVRVSITAWVCLCLFAGYAIVTTHDYAATLAARTRAANELAARNVPLNNISVGLEHDGWMQLTLAGTVRPLRLTDDRRNVPFWFWYFAPDLHPAYKAVTTAYGSDRPSGTVLSVPFDAWTPPFRRQIAIVRLAQPYQVP
jgi:hypothetical protein